MLKATGSIKAIPVDCVNDMQSFARAHIPSAKLLPWTKWLKSPSDPQNLVDEDVFRRMVGTVGAVSLDDQLVFYETAGTLMAARAWWVFAYYGFSNARVLNTGWAGYASSGAVNVETGAMPEGNVSPSSLAFKRQPQLLATTEQVLDAINTPSKRVQLLDTRSAGEYAGTDARGLPVTGHIPGAVNIPHNQLLDATGALLPPKELRRKFREAGLKPELPVVAYCLAGVRGALGTLALKEAAYEQAACYDGSMEAWTQDVSRPLVH
jgi:thiosulfate/3-mercaptopyruvate sulfurtransferase